MTSGRSPAPYIAIVNRALPQRRPTPTLLVFSLGSEGDRRRRPLLPSRLAGLERELRRQCLDSVLEAGRRAGLRLDLATLDPGDGKQRARRGAYTTGGRDDSVRRFAQRGTGFGQRLANALEDARHHAASARGHRGSEIVLVGGDTPGLGSGHLRRALELTRRDPDSVVIGPSPDGGFYLLAAARPVDEALAAVRWCGAHTRRDLVEALERAGRTVHLLEPLADLDRPSDLDALLRHDWTGTGLARLTGTILAALRQLARPLHEVEPGRIAPRCLAGAALRAPPA